MPYNINLTDGSLFATVADGAVDTTSDSLTLVGKNKAGYGQILNQNVIRLLENSAFTTAPSAPVVGQLWYDTANEQLKVWDGVDFKAVAATATAAAPTSPVVGDTWYDTVNNQLNVYNGTDFILVGGEAAPSTVETIDDDVAGSHIITKFYVDGTVVAIASADATFTVDPLEPLVATFPTLSPGIQVAASAQFIGDATNALSLGGVLATNYLRSDAADTTAGTLGILDDAGLTVGAGGNGAAINVASPDVTFENNISDGDVILQVNDGGIPTPVITLDGASARARVSAPLAANDIVNLTYLNNTALTGANIKSLYELEANAYTDSKDTKLTGIEALAEVNPTDLEIKNSYETGNYFNHPSDTGLMNFNYTLQSVIMTAGLALTAWNMLAGRRCEVIITNTTGGALNVTLDANWKSFGEASPISVPAGKALVLSMTSLTAAATGVYVAAVLEN